MNGKHHVADVRHKTFGSTPGDISTWSDYAEQFSFEPDGQLQNEFFDNNRTLSMEGCCVDHFRKTVNARNVYDNGSGHVNQSNDTVREFNFYISYSMLQNAGW